MKVIIQLNVNGSDQEYYERTILKKDYKKIIAFVKKLKRKNKSK